MVDEGAVAVCSLLWRVFVRVQIQWRFQLTVELLFCFFIAAACLSFVTPTARTTSMFFYGLKEVKNTFGFKLPSNLNKWLMTLW